VVVAGATAYGFGVELLQVPLPYREFALADVLANAVGATLSLGWLAVEHYVSE
jgi:VanZ family protein